MFKTWRPLNNESLHLAKADLSLREGFKKKKKKVMEFSITSEGTPPPLKLWKTFFYLFYILVLKSVLMQRNFFYITLSQKIQD